MFVLTKRLNLWVMLITVLFAHIATAQETTSPNAQDKQPIPLQELRTFTEIFDRIRTSYVNEVDDATLFKYAINGMLNALDPHSAYLEDDDFADLQEHTTGKFGGLGIEISQEDGLILVVSPIDDTPAQKAGIQAGDLIVRIDNEAVLGLSLNQAIEKMRGAIGEKIELDIRRKGEKELLKFSLIRAEIKVASVRNELLDNDIGYIRITQFQENTGNDLTKLLKNWQSSQELDGLILDLRNNPGGVLDAAAEVVDAFIDQGLIVYTEGRSPDSKIEFKATANTPAKDIPLVVLINSGSASASEIVAGALQDHQRAVILGTQSFGKGSVQSILPLTENSAVKLTTARYFTPKGRSIQAQGIVPDIIIEQSEVTPFKTRTFKEADLPRHLDNDSKNNDKNNKTTEQTKQDSKEPEPKSLIDKDFQLYEAYTLLRGINILSKKG